MRGLGVGHQELAGQGAAEGVGDLFPAAAVEVDACIAEGRRAEQVVGRPERGGEDVGDAGLAAAIAGLPSVIRYLVPSL